MAAMCAPRTGFGQDRDNVTRMRTTVTDVNDPNKIKRETFYDLRSLVAAIKEFDAGQPIRTSYVYDPVEQLVQIRDDHNNPTTIGYDTLGRRTVVDSPDAGKTEVIFDAASNVIGKVTGNLRPLGQQINYDYDFNRLTGIRYPTFAGNNVTYTYGAPGALDNRAGRITRVSDQSGNEERFYGRLGEITKEIKTVLSETGQPEVYTSQYLFDTFGRLQR
jgi:YD repeat-containing protein